MNEIATVFQKHLKVDYIEVREHFVLHFYLVKEKKKSTLFEINDISAVY